MHPSHGYYPFRKATGTDSLLDQHYLSLKIRIPALTTITTVKTNMISLLTIQFQRSLKCFLQVVEAGRSDHLFAS
jgi:hypothetical protein